MLPESIIREKLLSKKQHDQLVNGLGFQKVNARCPVCYTLSTIAHNIGEFITLDELKKLVMQVEENSNTNTNKSDWHEGYNTALWDLLEKVKECAGNKGELSCGNNQN